MTDPGERRREHALSFGSVAREYAATRPSYPADVVPFLLGDATRRVLDLGAGTGLFSRALLAAGHQVVAVDPSVQMLAQLRAGLPEIEAVVGSAERVPLADGEVDAVVAGQAAHWFDPPAAAREIRRVLRPGGVVGLVWTVPDERVSWVAALGALSAAVRRGHEVDEDVVAAFARELEATTDRLESDLVERLSPEQVVAGIATRSYVATMGEAERAHFLDAVRELLRAHPDTRGRELLELPYVTVGHRFTPR